MTAIVITLALCIAPALLVIAYAVECAQPRPTREPSEPVREYLAWREEQLKQKVVSINDWR